MRATTTDQIVQKLWLVTYAFPDSHPTDETVKVPGKHSMFKETIVKQKGKKMVQFKNILQLFIESL